MPLCNLSEHTGVGLCDVVAFARSVCVLVSYMLQVHLILMLSCLAHVSWFGWRMHCTILKNDMRSLGVVI